MEGRVDRPCAARRSDGVLFDAAQIESADHGQDLAGRDDILDVKWLEDFLLDQVQVGEEEKGINPVDHHFWPLDPQARLRSCPFSDVTNTP